MVALQEAIAVWLEDADEPPSVPSTERLRANRLPVGNALWAALEAFSAVFVPVPRDGA